MMKLTDKSCVKPSNLAHEDFNGEEDPQTLWRVLYWDYMSLKGKSTKVRMTKYFANKEYCDAWVNYLKDTGCEMISIKEYFVSKENSNEKKC